MSSFYQSVSILRDNPHGPPAVQPAPAPQRRRRQFRPGRPGSNGPSGEAASSGTQDSEGAVGDPLRWNYQVGVSAVLQYDARPPGTQLPPLAPLRIYALFEVIALMRQLPFEIVSVSMPLIECRVWLRVHLQRAPDPHPTPTPPHPHPMQDSRGVPYLIPQ